MSDIITPEVALWILYICGPLMIALGLLGLVTEVRRILKYRKDR